MPDASKQRDQRLAAALRANLQRRKAQSRQRRQAGEPGPGEPAPAQEASDGPVDPLP